VRGRIFRSRLLVGVDEGAKKVRNAHRLGLVFRFNKLPRPRIIESILRGAERWEAAQSFLGLLQALDRFYPDMPPVIRTCSKNIVPAIHVVSPRGIFYDVIAGKVFLVGNENCSKQHTRSCAICSIFGIHDMVMYGDFRSSTCI
jgi:hypothetical protein